MHALDAASNFDPIVGPWYLQEYFGRKSRADLTCISTFSGAGGSTMGWGLAGFNVIGAVEIDPKMAEVYRRNLRPQNFYLGAVGDFAHDPPAWATSQKIDVVDGSPPCSTFST